MARDVTRILRKLRGNPRFRVLPRTAQALLTDLILQPTLSSAGVLPLMVDKWATACDELTPDGVRADLRVLLSARFVVIDFDTFEAMICGYVRDSGVTAHRNHATTAARAAETVDSPMLRQALAIELYELDRPDMAEVIEALAPLTDPDPSAMETGSEADGIGMATGSEVDG
ncbi:hypothetical protein [Nocardia sp. NBC_01327]|uniref:hypothetical protein n=1 Tax=Nocardia sp. NBC_01327 TaxID=2903593 RepID=UPI002E150A7B|nr:hypothetical protein OG326_24075 [Nocardia sp. NBC_01327]